MFKFHTKDDPMKDEDVKINVTTDSGMITHDGQKRIPVRIDSKTVIFVKPGENIKEHVEKFRNRAGMTSYLPWAQ